MSESSEQKTVVAYFRAQYPQYAMSLRVSQSGGFRGKGREGAIRSRNVQSMGGIAGEADIAILLPRGGFGSLLIEHKAADGRYGATPAQLSYLEYHNACGNCAVLTRGIQAAIAAIDAYMAMPDTAGYSQTLIEYLEDHESDIAWGINDFVNLKGIFIEAMGRNPIK